MVATITIFKMHKNKKNRAQRLSFLIFHKKQFFRKHGKRRINTNIVKKVICYQRIKSVLNILSEIL